jgi:HPt (histidine-containing phosphotransfer) domain-containing protein
MKTPETHAAWREHVRRHLMTTFHAPPATAEQLLVVAETTLRQGITDLSRALNTNKGPALAKSGHFLKGALTNMGLMTLADQAARIEALAAAQPEEAARQGEALRRALDALLPPNTDEAV